MMVSNISGVGSYRADARHMNRRWSIPTAWRNWRVEQALTAHGSSRRFTTSQIKSLAKKAAKAMCATILSRKPDWGDQNLPASHSKKIRSISLGGIQTSGGGLDPGHWARAYKR